MKPVINKKTPVLMVLVLTSAVIPLSLKLAGFNLSVGKVISAWARVTGTVGCFYNPTLMSDLNMLATQLFCDKTGVQIVNDGCNEQIACAATQKKVVPFDEIADPAMPKPKPKDDKEKGGHIADPGETRPKPKENSDDEEAIKAIGAMFIPVQTPKRIVNRRAVPIIAIAGDQKLEPPTWEAVEGKTVELVSVIANEEVFRFNAIYRPELIKRTKELTNCNFAAVKAAMEMERLRAGKFTIKMKPAKVDKADETELETRTSQSEDEF
jgi:hypothetical protein